MEHENGTYCVTVGALFLQAGMANAFSSLEGTQASVIEGVCHYIMKKLVQACWTYLHVIACGIMPCTLCFVVTLWDNAITLAHNLMYINASLKYLTQLKCWENQMCL